MPSSANLIRSAVSAAALLAAPLAILPWRRPAAKGPGFEAALRTRLLEASAELIGGASSSDSRHSICSAARIAADAPVAILWEPSPDSRVLRIAAASGALLADRRVDVRPGGGTAADVYLQGRPRLAADLGTDEPGLAGLASASAYWQPIGVAPSVSGVVELRWPRRKERLSELEETALGMIAPLGGHALERAQATERLASLAMTDALTGLPNRRAWETEIGRALSQAVREQWPVCVALIDIDRFKEHNDRYGHAAGDSILREVSAAWSGALRPTDLLARFGGDEFAVILPHCTPPEAYRLIERLRSAIEIRVSAGIAAWDGEESSESLVKRADFALYRAKRTGRDRALTAPQSGFFGGTEPGGARSSEAGG